MNNKRILAVDVLRGFTVCLMIIVNNGAGKSWDFLRHAQWNGLTPCDMVFPFFLFIMGVSTCLALSKGGFKADRSSLLKVVRRTVGIILVCWGIYFFEKILNGEWLPFESFRLTGVLARIALAYFFTAVFALTLDHKWMLPTAMVLLVSYAAILLLGNGYVSDETNILARVDAVVLGQKHLYSHAAVDPEGLLGVIPSIAHAMLGFLCGKLLISPVKLDDKMKLMSLRGAVMLLAGMVLAIFLPLNKKVWSPSFVLVTCGCAAILLSLLMLILDKKQKTSWSTFFKVFGMNALFLYALSEILATIQWKFNIAGEFSGWLRDLGFSSGWASFTYAFLFMLVNWCVGYLLYRKKIFIKL